MLYTYKRGSQQTIALNAYPALDTSSAAMYHFEWYIPHVVFFEFSSEQWVAIS